jgi:hypothetical protein
MPMTKVILTPLTFVDLGVGPMTLQARQNMPAIYVNVGSSIPPPTSDVAIIIGWGNGEMTANISSTENVYCRSISGNSELIKST